MAASSSTRNSSSPGPRDNCRTRCGSKAATARRIRTAIREDVRARSLRSLTMTLPATLWPWLALIGLGLFHGINPAMGWLFAVALGLHRHSQKVVLLSLVPIALGHA